MTTKTKDVQIVSKSQESPILGNVKDVTKDANGKKTFKLKMDVESFKNRNTITERSKDEEPNDKPSLIHHPKGYYDRNESDAYYSIRKFTFKNFKREYRTPQMNLEKIVEPELEKILKTKTVLTYYAKGFVLNARLGTHAIGQKPIPLDVPTNPNQTIADIVKRLR